MTMKAQRDRVSAVAARLIICSGLLISAWAAPSRMYAVGAAIEVVDPDKLDRKPVPLRQVPPDYPTVLREQKMEGQAVVEFIVLPDGTVDSARAVQSTRQEFADAALAAVRQWRFQPALRAGQPVATRMQVPLVFNLTPSPLESLRFELGPPQLTADIRFGGRGVILTLVPVPGPGASQVQAARFLLRRAQDNTGAELKQPGTPAFYHEAVGCVDGDQAKTTARRPITIDLMGLGKDATALTNVEGTLELYAPVLDPDAVVTVAPVYPHLGVAVEAPALRKAGITLVVYDRETANKLAAEHSPDGPQEYDSSDMFGADYVDASFPPAVAKAMKQAKKAQEATYPPEFAARMKTANEMGPADIAVGVCDPQSRFLALEFQGADGSPIPYNHNGRAHSSRPAEKKQFHVYDLGSALPKDAKLVCWVLTEKSVIPVAFNLENVPLRQPERQATGH